jgi:glycerol-3-phosphate acyltransferase PlsY
VVVGTAVVTAIAILTAAYLAGALPISNVFARRLRGVDLRDVGTGTVSGTGLYRVAGFGPLAVAGILEIAKGALGPLLARDHHALAAAAGGLAVGGHAWSVFLGFAGGRGISPAIGATAVTAWPGAVVLLAGLAAGRLMHHTALGSFLADVALVPVMALTHGANGALAGVAVLVPLVGKRLVGNARPAPGADGRVWLNRLLYDADRRTP